MKIALSINNNIINKPDGAFTGTQTRTWEQREWTLEELTAHIKEGKAFSCAAMSSNHRKDDNFKHADIAAVDIDEGLTLDEFKKHELYPYAFWTYTTPSHHKEGKGDRFRVLFRLPERIDDKEQFKVFNNFLIRKLGGDTSASDACRIFYGNSNCESGEYKPDAQLPTIFVQEAKEQAQRDREAYAAYENDEAVTEDQIALADYLLRNNFIDITKERAVLITVGHCAKSVGGDRLRDALNVWISGNHHGTGKNSKRLELTDSWWRGLEPNRCGIKGIFGKCKLRDPDWWSKVPPEFKSSYTSRPEVMHASGYSYDAFNSSDEDEPAGKETQSFLDAAQTSVAVEPKEADFDCGFELEEPIGDLSTSSPNRSDRSTRTNGDSNSDTGKLEQLTQRLNEEYPGLRLNIMSQELEYQKDGKIQKGHDFSTAYINISRGTDTVFQKHHVFDLATVIGYENRYHPVHRYFKYCCERHNEECEYFEHIATTILGVSSNKEQNPPLKVNGKTRLLADVIIERFLIGAVARVMEPGCRHDWMPILIGGQNLGKSTFFQYLTPPSHDEPGSYPWVSTMQQGIEYIKDKPHTLHSGWIVVLDEAERYFKRKYTEELKNLISVAVDRSAKKYENEKNYPRSFVLAGATNNTDFLCDPTGNRRFMPILVKGKVQAKEDPNLMIIDLDRLAKDRDSIWATAYRRYMDKAATSHSFSSYELSSINDYINSFTKDNPIDARVQSIVNIPRNSQGLPDPSQPRSIREEHEDGLEYIRLENVFESLGVGIDRHSSMTGPITDSLKRAGWEPKRISKDGKKIRVWIAPKRSKTEIV